MGTLRRFTSNTAAMSALKIVSAAAVSAAIVYLLTKRRSPKPKSIKVTYFDIKATPGEKIRLALTLSGTPFTDNRVKFDDFRNNIKPKAKFGQLPIVEIDGKEFYQSGSMLRWAGTLGDGSLYPSDPASRMKVEEVRARVLTAALGRIASQAQSCCAHLQMLG